MSVSPRSAFLSLDGLDGTGKSSQLTRLADHLRTLGLTITTCTDPGGTELGAKLREILLHGRQQSMSMQTEALLFMASRAELVNRVITPALKRGEVVISDRYLLANVVYQGHAGGVNPDDLWNLGKFATHGIEPDLTILLDLPVSIARVRRGSEKDRMESRDDNYFQKVRDGFLLEAKRRESIAVVDASGSMEQVEAEINKIAVEFLKVRGILT